MVDAILRRVLGKYARRYNNQRPQRSLALRPPIGIDPGSARPLSRSLIALGVGIVSGVWCTSSVRPPHDVQISEPTVNRTRFYDLLR